MDGSVTALEDGNRPRDSESGENGPSLVVKLEARDEQIWSVASQSVDIYASSQSSVQQSTSASSSVRSHPIANQVWDQQFYLGSLVAWSKKYLAYALKGRSGPVIRVIDPATSSRSLLKGMMVGSVADLAFAGTSCDWLACVDEAGSLFIWKVCQHEGNIEGCLKLFVVRDDQPENLLTQYHRVLWCPQSSFTDDESDEDEDDHLPHLAVSNGTLAEVWDIGLTSSAQVGEESVSRQSLHHGVIVIKGAHEKPISDMSLSPDGSVLATASLDGHVKFWSVQNASVNPQCLHDWEPHGGRPVSRILFCDNHIDEGSNAPAWRFLLTGAEMNRELKMWCTVTWKCLQTIRFHPHDGDTVDSQRNPVPCLQVFFDLSASYLVLSDIKRTVAYVMNVEQDIKSGSALMTSLSEFILTQPLLSFTVACVEKKQQALDDDDGILSGDIVMPASSACADGVGVTRVLLKMYCIHTRSIQEHTLRFPLSQTMNASSVEERQVIQQSEEVEHSQDPSMDGLPNVETDDRNQSAVDLSVSLNEEPIKLIPPGEFSSLSPTVPAANVPQKFEKSGLGSRTSSTFSSVSNLSLDDDIPKTSATALSSLSSLNSVPQRSHAYSPQISSIMSLNPFGSAGFGQQRSVLQPASFRFFHPNMSASVPPREIVTEVDDGLDDGLDVETENGSFDMGNKNEEDEESLSDVKSSPVTVSLSSSSRSELQVKESEECAEDKQETRLEETEPLPIFPSPPGHEQLHRLFVESEKKVDRMPEVEGELDEQPKQAPLTATLESATSALDTSSSIQDNSNIPLENLLRDSASADIVDDTMAQASKTGVADLITEGVTGSDDEPTTRPEVRDTTTLKELEIVFATSSQSVASVVNEQSEGAASQQIVRHLSSVPNEQSEMEAEHLHILSSRSVAHGDGRIKELLEELLRCVTASQTDAAHLSQLLYEQRQEQQSALADIQRKVSEVETSLGDRVDSLLAAYSAKQEMKIDASFQDRQLTDKQRQERLQATVQQSVTSALQGRVDRAVKMEIKNTVIPSINKIFSPVQEQINQTLAQKLTVADQLLRDNIAKMTKSKPVIDAISQSVGSILQTTLPAAFQQTFQSAVVPSFEAACQTMCKQMNDTFQKGTEEYVRHFQQCVNDQKSQLQAAVEQVPRGVQPLIDTCQRLKDDVVPAMSASVREAVEQHMAARMERMQLDIIENVKRAIQDGIAESMPLSSDVRTDMPSAMIGKEQVKANLLQLVADSKIAEAFQDALTSNDLDLVVLVCEAVNPESLFSEQRCPLSQPILLSLIQQLCCDLKGHLGLKHKYIESALLALDTTDEVTSEHLPSVVSLLIQQLKGTIGSLQANEPSNSLLKPLKMLQMAAQSFLQ
ncbi:enhancer of mRNA-decapping protein 4-like isoform X2 [Corticium candelabrum]|uniref:enhancer of mRNA-decapping protein 4-like isoform X2 n=1 Tax=Corticium candelabrum TaxID=121492 RepID=UPI002E252807|nr:enhancer of mRNA-decapping protein 4-like isoform X2 [Corticium candelabrum]